MMTMISRSDYGKRLKSFFSYFGSKNGSSHRYPPPEQSHIVEPFAGAAGYSCRYWQHNVILVEKDPVIFGIWDWLINVATKDEILAIPADVDTLEQVPSWVDVRAKNLIGMCFAAGRPAPAKKRSPYNKADKSSFVWGEKKRTLLIEQISKIQHWQVINGDYSSAPDIKATWYIDPPYMTDGYKYRHGSSGIDYEQLSRWCKSRRGFTMVCEAQDAKWLPFERLGEWGGLHSRGVSKTKESIWINRR